MITYHRAMFTGQYVAACSDCRFTCAYWESEEELEHDCAEQNEILCCGQIVKWADCSQHEECYYFYCAKCGENSPTDCADYPNKD